EPTTSMNSDVMSRRSSVRDLAATGRMLRAVPRYRTAVLSPGGGAGTGRVLRVRAASAYACASVCTALRLFIGRCLLMLTLVLCYLPGPHAARRHSVVPHAPGRALRPSVPLVHSGRRYRARERATRK